MSRRRRISGAVAAPTAALVLASGIVAVPALASLASGHAAVAVTLTNISSTACLVETDPALALRLSHVVVDGVPAAAVSAPVQFESGFTAAAVAAVASLSPARSRTLQATAVRFSGSLTGFGTVVHADGDDGAGVIWPASSTAAVQADVSYRVPAVRMPAGMCTSRQLRVTAVAGATSGSPRPATIVGAGGAQTDVGTAVGQIRAAGDPGGVVETSSADGNTVTVREIPPDQQGKTWGTEDGPAIDWPDGASGAYPGGVPRDGVAVLDHELSHAAERIRYGYADRRNCLFRLRNGTVVDSNITVTEVRATRTENAYRVAAGLPVRADYGQREHPLPPNGSACLPLHASYSLADTTTHDDKASDCGYNFVVDNHCVTAYDNAGKVDVVLAEQPFGYWRGSATLTLSRSGYREDDNGTDEFQNCPATATSRLVKATRVTVSVEVRLRGPDDPHGGEGKLIRSPVLIQFDNGDGWTVAETLDDCGTTSSGTNKYTVISDNLLQTHSAVYLRIPPQIVYRGFVPKASPPLLDTDSFEFTFDQPSVPYDGQDTVGGRIVEDLVVETQNE